jgi:hypothetical protein
MRELIFLPKYNVNRIERFLSRSEFNHQFVQSGTPVIIMNEFESNNKWTFNWLKENLGDINITVGHGLLKQNIKDFSKRNTTLGEYIETIFSETEERDYFGAVDLTKVVPNLKQRIDLHDYYINKKLQKINFFVGPGNTVSQLHCDYAENIFSQFVGKKRIQLYSPKTELSKYKMHESFTSCYNLLESEDISERQVKLLSAPDYDFVIESGQALYIPFGWWHRVTSLEPSISIAQWWINYNQFAQRVCFFMKQAIFLKRRKY